MAKEGFMPRRKKENNEKMLPILTNDNNTIDMEALKDDLKDYVSLEIKKGFTEEVEKANKRLIKEKNKAILFRDILIILLIAVVGFLIYLLYQEGFFSKILSNNKITNNPELVIEEKNQDEPKKEEVKKPTQEELKKEYGSLLDNYIMMEDALYLDDFYSGKLTPEIRSYLTLRMMKKDTFSKEDDYQIIEEEDFKKSYLTLFNSDFSPISFDYNGNKIRYINKMNAYMTSTILKDEETSIVREILEIKESDGKIEITTVEGIIRDNYIFNVVTRNFVANNDGDLKNFADKLNKITYVFENNQLINLVK